MITAKSRMTAFVIGLSAIFVLGLGKTFTRSAFFTLLLDGPFGKEMQARLVIIIEELFQIAILTLTSYVQAMYKLQSCIKVLLQLCLLKGSFCCLFFFRGSVIILFTPLVTAFRKSSFCSWK